MVCGWLRAQCHNFVDIGPLGRFEELEAPSKLSLLQTCAVTIVCSVVEQSYHVIIAQLFKSSNKLQTQ